VDEVAVETAALRILREQLGKGRGPTEAQLEELLEAL